MVARRPLVNSETEQLVQVPWFSAFFTGRVKLVAAAAAILLGVLIGWSRYFVEPRQTVNVLQLWVSGSPNGLYLEIDRDLGFVSVTAAPSGLPDIVVTDVDVFWPAELAPTLAPEAVWIRVPLHQLPGRLNVLTPKRVSDALDRKARECRPLGEDGTELASLLLGGVVPPNEELCERYVGDAAVDGQTVLVSIDPERASIDLAEVEQQSMPYDESPDPSAVLEAILNAIQTLSGRP